LTGEGLGWRAGGSSANLACALSSAGHDVRLFGPVGSDAIGDDLVAELDRWGVDTAGVFRMPGSSPRTLILLDSTGERTMIGMDGAPKGWRFMPTEEPDLSSADCVYVESYTRYPVSIANAAGSAMLVTSPPREGAIAWPSDVVLGSQSQYNREMLESPYASVRAVAGPRLRWVVVTRGESGADAYGSDDHLHAEAPNATPVDTTGAGDAFAAGLIHGILRGASITVAMDVGAAWGAEAVTRLQSLPPHWSDALAARQVLE
jgi:sugar/nucleoside kinase (ribokinase family)